jgi:hypothetical protein
MPFLYKDSHQKIVLLYAEKKDTVEYISYIDKKVDLLKLSKDNFYKQYKEEQSKKSVAENAKSMLALKKNGIIISPAAQFALEQMTTKVSFSNTEEEKETKKSASKKKDVSKIMLKINKSPKIMPKVTKIERVLNEVDKSKVIANEALEKSALNQFTDKLDDNLEDKANEPLPWKESKETVGELSDDDADVDEALEIVNSAKNKAALMLLDARNNLLKAQETAEKKRKLDAANAEAAKILADAEKEIKAIRLQIKKLTPKGKSTQKNNKESRKRVKSVDISGKKITVIREPRKRGQSERGDLIQAICKCKTTDEAIDKLNVKQSFILALVKNGCIELS